MRAGNQCCASNSCTWCHWDRERCVFGCGRRNGSHSQNACTECRWQSDSSSHGIEGAWTLKMDGRWFLIIATRLNMLLENTRGASMETRARRSTWRHMVFMNPPVLKFVIFVFSNSTWTFILISSYRSRHWKPQSKWVTILWYESPTFLTRSTQAARVLLRVDDIVQATRKEKASGGGEQAPPPEEEMMEAQWV